MAAKDDPKYGRFFKMVNMGVPLTAVKMKAAADGLDPAVLDNPDAPIGGAAPAGPPAKHLPPKLCTNTTMSSPLKLQDFQVLPYMRLKRFLQDAGVTEVAQCSDKPSLCALAMQVGQRQFPITLIVKRYPAGRSPGDNPRAC